MKYLDLFSGYGGFRLALERAGFKFSKVWFSEIDKYAIANYRYNLPEAEWLGSVTDIPDIGKVDLITFGWPCQDNSIAGKRKGQTGDTRSGLLFHVVNCIERFKPGNFIAENVEGLRTVNKGIDFVESLKILAFLNDSMPQYDIEMQLLNTLQFAVPQNRERLFFVGHLRESGGGDKRVFPIYERNGEINEVEIQVGFRTNIAPLFNISMPEITRRNIASRFYLRDLTPIEYERLQGLPDNYTKFGIINNEVVELSKNARYKLCGNGVSIPPVQTIGEKLLKIVETEKLI